MPTMTATDWRKTFDHDLAKLGTDPRDVPSEIVWQMMGDDISPATAARKIHNAAIEAAAE